MAAARAAKGETMGKTKNRLRPTLLAGILAVFVFFTGIPTTKADGGFFMNIFSGGAPKYTLLDETHDAQGLERIEISMVSDAIEILAEDRSDVQITYLCSDDNPDRSPRVSVQGGTLLIEAPRDMRVFFSLGWSGRLTVRVPESLTLAYDLNNTSGSVDVDGVRMKSAKVNCVSGSIRLSPDLSVRASYADISNTSGSIRVAAAAERLHVNTVSGGVRAEGAFGTVDASTTSGGVRVECWTAPSSVDLGSVSGSTRLTLPADIPGFVLDTSSVSGKLHNDFAQNPYGDRSLVVRMHTVSGGMYVMPGEVSTTERDEPAPERTSGAPKEDAGGQRVF